MSVGTRLAVNSRWPDEHDELLLVARNRLVRGRHEGHCCQLLRDRILALTVLEARAERHRRVRVRDLLSKEVLLRRREAQPRVQRHRKVRVRMVDLASARVDTPRRVADVHAVVEVCRQLLLGEDAAYRSRPLARGTGPRRSRTFPYGVCGRCPALSQRVHGRERSEAAVISSQISP